MGLSPSPWFQRGLFICLTLETNDRVSAGFDDGDQPTDLRPSTILGVGDYLNMPWTYADATRPGASAHGKGQGIARGARARPHGSM
jgi:hypothetical protein